jgi:Methylamine utilisation protein MauE
MFDSASAGRYGRRDVTPDTIAPLYFLAASLLLVSGVLKLVEPRATAQAMLDAGLPGSRPVARGLGAGECAAAAFAAWAPARGGALALAIVYLAFAGFVGYVLRTHPTAGSCGCAGSKAVPPSLLHLCLDVVAAAAGLAYLALHGPSAGVWFAGLGWGSVPVLAGLMLAGWLLVVVVTEVPPAWRAWTPPTDDRAASHADRHLVAEDALSIAGIGPGHPSLWPGVAADAGAPG